MWRDRLRHRRTPYISRSRDLVRLTKLAFLAVIVIFLGAFVVLPIFSFGLPSPDKIVRQSGFSTKILDRNGEVLYDIYANQNRTPVQFSDIPVYLREATISIEDKNFYKHQGFDPTGILRAAYYIVIYRKLQGGSTLTQQLVKTVLLTPDRTIFRKIREFILAIQIERKYSKDQILQMYLNEAPYGGTAWGVEAASEVYYGKKVKDLNLVESAILAGFPQSPSYYSPFTSTSKAYVNRTYDVLRRMREDGYITKDQEQGARAQVPNVQFAVQGASFKAPHFVQYVQKILNDRYGESVVEKGGLKVTTTLDWKLQDKAQQIVSDEISKVESQHITNGAAVVMDPQTGEILAMVGSKNFNDPNYDGQFNAAVDALRQPGSSFKPFTYVTAFHKGFTAATLLIDVPTTFPGGANNPDYKPVNYDGKYRGPMQVRFALANSINIAAVKMLAMVGIKDVLQTATDLGITTLPPTQDTLNRVGLSLTLGGGDVRLLDMTDAYSPFMNKGYNVEPVSILKVEDANGKVLEETKPKKGRRVLSEEEAWLIANILSDNNARAEIFGTNSLLNISGITAAVKTGTTNDKKDNWTIGGNPNSVVGVWVGNNDNTSMLNVASGVSGASPIWRSILLAALVGKPNVGFDKPGGIVTAGVDSVSGYGAHDGYSSRQEYFIKGTEPGKDAVHVKLKVCKNDGKLATPSDIAGGNYDEKEFFVFKEEDPTAGSGQPNKWQEGINAWLTTQGDSRYHPPSDYCGTSNPLDVEFVNPTDHGGNLPNNFTVKFTANSTSDIVNADLYIDGSKVRSYSGPPYEYPVTNLSKGPHTFRAVAQDSANHQSDRSITACVGVAWDCTATPTPSATPTPTPSPAPTPT